jgi:uncharacterized protein YcbX
VTATVAAIWRHPIKSHGIEALISARLSPGATLPGDRLWAVLHDAAKPNPEGWSPCVNFSRVAKAPGLAAIRATLHADGATVTLSHPDRDDLTFAPDDEADTFLAWVKPLVPQDRAQPSAVLRNDTRGFTDTPEPTISLCNLASNRAVGQKLGQDLSPLRWRGNIWLDGLALWEEFEWVGKRIALGDAELEVTEPIVRCTATMANPETGRRDADTLQALETGWGHRNFGIYAVVTRAGEVPLGAEARVL